MKSLVVPILVFLAAVGTLFALERSSGAMRLETGHAELALADAAAAPSSQPAVTVPDPTQNPGGFIGFVVDLVSKKEWLPLAGAILVGFVALLRFGIGFVPVLGAAAATKAGGYIVNGVAAFFLALGGAFASGTGWSVGLLGSTLAAGLVASGVYEAIRDFAGSGQASKPAVKPSVNL